jgi:antitoxin (DNA-binding transcriptional repressor) of toxin-antitoxin stability system
MKRITVHKAKTTLSQLIADVEAGEDVVILRGTEPVVRLVPAGRAAPARVYGALAGKVTVSSAFFEPLPPDELSAWEQ